MTNEKNVWKMKNKHFDTLFVNFSFVKHFSCVHESCEQCKCFIQFQSVFVYLYKIACTCIFACTWTSGQNQVQKSYYNIITCSNLSTWSSVFIHVVL